VKKMALSFLRFPYKEEKKNLLCFFSFIHEDCDEEKMFAVGKKISHTQDDDSHSLACELFSESIYISIRSLHQLPNITLHCPEKKYLYSSQISNRPEIGRRV
jgi:hypothetical protein